MTTLNYNGEELILQIGTYQDNKALYLGLLTVDGEPFLDVTVNFDASSYCGYIDTPNFPDLGAFLEENEIGYATGLSQSSGFCTYPHFLFDVDVLSRLDPDGYEKYEEELKAPLTVLSKEKITTEQLFNRIIKDLKMKGYYPISVDYSNGNSWKSTDLETSDISILTNLDYGSSEGIYLNISFAFSENGIKKIVPAGTVKTLGTEHVDMRTMAKLLGDFIYFGYSYIEEHSDDFLWSGRVIKFYKDKEVAMSYYCSDEQKAEEIASKSLKSYSSIEICDLKTRTCSIYKEKGELNNEG